MRGTFQKRKQVYHEKHIYFEIDIANAAHISREFGSDLEPTTKKLPTHKEKAKQLQGTI
jgi:hypothetical protein